MQRESGAVALDLTNEKRLRRPADSPTEGLVTANVVVTMGYGNPASYEWNDVMKNARKQELQTHVLGDWLGGVTNKVAPHARTIAIGVVAFAAFAIAYSVISWKNNKEGGEGWQSLFAAARNADEEGFGETAKVYAGDKAGSWAELAKANIAMTAAAGEMARDPRTALKQFEEVIAQYQEIVNKADAGSMLYERAQYGRAVANEYLASVSPKGQADKVKVAEGIYRAWAKDGSKAIKKAAEDNLALLELYASSPSGWDNTDPDRFQPGTWLAWLAAKNYEPPANRHGPNSLFAPGGSGLGGSGLGGSGLGGSGSGLDGSGLGGSGLGSSGLGGSGLGGSTSGTDKTGLLNEIGKGLEKGSDDKFPLDLNKKGGAKKGGAKKDGAKKDGAKKDGAKKDSVKKDGAKKGANLPDRSDAFPTNKKDGQPTTKDGAKKGTNPLNAPSNNKKGTDKKGTDKKGTDKASPKKAPAGKSAEKKTGDAKK